MVGDIYLAIFIIYICYTNNLKTKKMNIELNNFIEYHKIDTEDLFDAKGASISEIRDEMKQLNKLFAYNAKPCGQAGHTIRDRHNHCIVCNTAHIAFMKRTKVTAYIYIAGSILKQYIKIGMTTENVEKRLGKLNSRKVGDTNDWVPIKAIKCDYANIVEMGIQKKLEQYKVDGVLSDDGTESNEIFRCKYDKANETLEDYVKNNNIIKKENKTFISNPEKYNSFRNIINPKHIK